MTHLETTTACTCTRRRLALRRCCQALGATMLLAWAASASAMEPVSTPAGPDGPAQTVYQAAKQPAPTIILLSGQTGPANYQAYAAEVAKAGYNAVLLDGKDILTRTQDGGANLRKAIARAQAAPGAWAGKVGVVGFSQGGGGALAHAVGLSNDVALVVLYYPATAWAQDLRGVVKRFKVPVLVLAAERDKYQGCCLIESMRAMEDAARGNNTAFELVVYPQADHGFNLAGSQFRKDDAADAWRRVQEKLVQYLPVAK